MNQVTVDGYDTLRILSNMCETRKIFSEVYAAATGVKSGYQTLSNALRANKGMTKKQADKFFHNIRIATDGVLATYKDDLRYAYYLLDWMMESGIIEKDESLRMDAMTPTEERQLERRFGNGYEPTGNGNVEGLSEEEETAELIRDKNGTVIVEPTKEEIEEFKRTGVIPDEQEETQEEVDVQDENTERIADADTTPVQENRGEIVNEKAAQETVDVDDVIAQLLSFGKKDQPEKKSDNDFLTNFLGEPTRITIKPSVSSDEFDNSLANVPDVFDKDSKKF